MMEIQSRHDLFEPGDKMALVCIDEPSVQKTVVDQLGSLDYKIHTGLSVDDISLKLRTHVYEVVIVYELFNHADLETNPVLQEVANLPTSQRRNQFVVLVGPTLTTDDEMQAFTYNVDIVFGIREITDLCPVLRRGALRHKEFYTAYHECVKFVEMM